jgi:hypothetical protein
LVLLQITIWNIGIFFKMTHIRRYDIYEKLIMYVKIDHR